MDGLAINGRDILNRCIVQVNLVINDAAQIAIGKDLDTLACGKQRTEPVSHHLPCNIFLKQYMPILHPVGPVGRFQQGGLVRNGQDSLPAP